MNFSETLISLQADFSVAYIPALLRRRFNRAMDSKEIRKINLQALLKESKLTQAKFADKVGTDGAYISQIISRTIKANVGDDLARRIENAFQKHRGWMDTLDHSGQRDFETDQLLKDFEAMPVGLREHIARKASELRKFADALPGYVKNSLKPPDDPQSYRAWERELEADMYGKVRNNEEETQ